MTETESILEIGPEEAKRELNGKLQVEKKEHPERFKLKKTPKVPAQRLSTGKKLPDVDTSDQDWTNH